ncbi:MAG: transposase [Thermaurantiacus sp.]
MDAHFAVSLQIQTLRHAHPRRMAGSSQKWQEGSGVALTEYASGAKVSELCRKHGMSDATLYK